MSTAFERMIPFESAHVFPCKYRNVQNLPHWHMHFSRPYFSKYFVTHTGMTFSHYLNTVRVAHAAELLREEKHTVTEISGLCGFNTIRNFNRVFRDLTGYTPSNLPKDYTFTYLLKEYADSGFDPTLAGTEVLEE